MANEGGEPFGLDIVEGDPTFTFKASYVHEGTASGVRIISNQSISDVINGRNGFYIFSRERPDDSTETDRIGIDGSSAAPINCARHYRCCLTYVPTIRTACSSPKTTGPCSPEPSCRNSPKRASDSTFRRK